MVRARIVIAAAVLCGAAGTARAQIVNVQGALAQAPVEDGVSGQAELKVTWREGNNSLVDVGGSGAVLVRRDKVLWLALARGQYGKSRGLTLTKKTFEHARVRIELDRRWRWEAFGQHEYDQFRRLSYRALVGTGPAYQIVDREAISVLGGAAYLLERERINERPGTDDAGQSATAHRASLYLTGRESLGAGVAIVQTIYAQPRIDRPSDVRLLGELSVVSKLTERIALKDSLTAAYDRTPPDGVERYDTALEVALLVSF
jgi:hypothetical protein